MAVEVLDITTHNGRTLPISGALLAYLLLGLIQYEKNKLDAAERSLRQCDDLARRYQVTMYEILAQFYLGYVRCPAAGRASGSAGASGPVSLTAESTRVRRVSCSALAQAG